MDEAIAQLLVEVARDLGPVGARPLSPPLLSDVSPPPDTPPPPFEYLKTAGMVNEGNDCYAIATLQALAHCPTFVKWVEDQPDSAKLPPIVKNLGSLFQDLNKVSPTGDLRNKILVQMKNRQYNQGQQHDAQEFLDSLLGQIDEALHGDDDTIVKPQSATFKYNKDGTGVLSTPHSSTLGVPFERILEGARRELNDGMSSINGLFSFIVFVYQYCDTCKDVRYAFEIKNSHGVIVPDQNEPIPAFELMQKSIYSDETSDAARLECGHQLFTEEKSIYSPPVILMAKLNRISYSNINGKCTIKKITTPIDYHSDPYVHLTRQDGDAVTYSLRAVVRHHGGGVGAGHFTAICKVGEVWYNFNDSSAKQLTDVEFSAIAQMDKCAYLLFYERVGSGASRPKEA